MAAKQSKNEEKQKNMEETSQKWQKTDKNVRKTGKMWSVTKFYLPSSHLCPAPWWFFPKIFKNVLVCS